jgi:lysosomal alpha-mannosidase
VHLSGLPNDGRGREVTVNWKSYDIKNNGVFYTDSNGLEMQRRVYGERPTWDLVTSENASANYYPVNTAISIVDEKSKLKMTVLNDRSQGGASLSAGQIELMQNRRLF